MLDLLDSKYGQIVADDFGPRKLQDIRDILIARGNVRSYINKQIKFVVRVFRHGVARELVEPMTVMALECVKALKFDEPRRQGVGTSV